MRQQITTEEIKTLRENTLQRLNNFLNGVEKKQEIFEWAKQIVVSPKFEEICKKDKILGNAIQSLFELHHSDEKYDPTKEELIFYKEQLNKS